MMFASVVSDPVVHRMGWVLVHSIWQFALIALLTAAALSALRTKAAMTRYATALIAMALLGGSPAVSWVMVGRVAPSAIAATGQTALVASGLPDCLLYTSDAADES